MEFKASDSDPYTNGWLCDKMTNFPDDVSYHPDRILSPLKQVGNKGDAKFESDLDIIKQTLQSDHEYLKGISFESLKKTGWARLNVPENWIPHENRNFKTISGKCEFYNASLSSPLPTYLPQDAAKNMASEYPLQLLSIKSTKNFLNSSHANLDYLIKKEGDPYLDLHVTDAKIRNLTDGETVRVFNPEYALVILLRAETSANSGTSSYFDSHREGYHVCESK